MNEWKFRWRGLKYTLKMLAQCAETDEEQKFLIVVMQTMKMIEETQLPSFVIRDAKEEREFGEAACAHETIN